MSMELKPASKISAPFPGVLLACFALNAVGMGGVFAACSVCFAANDDVAMQQIMSGSYGGQPSGYVLFVSYWLAFAVSRLFVVFPGMAWWFLTLLAFMWVSMSLISFALARSFVSSIGCFKKHPFVACAAASCFTVLVSSPFVVRMQFTYVSSYLGAAACLIAFTGFRNALEGNASNRSGLCFFVGAFLLFLSLSVRLDAGLVSAVLFALLCLLGLLRSRGIPYFGRLLRNLLLCLSLVAAMFVGAFAGNSLAYSVYPYDESVATNNARASYVDYPHRTYAQDPVAYEAVSWDASLAAAVSDWYFLDPRVDNAAFDYLAGATSVGKAGNLHASLDSLIEGRGVFSSTTVCLMLGLVLLSIAGCLFGRDRWSQISGSLSLLFLATMMFYLACMGRLIVRSVVPVVVPLLFLLLAYLGSVRWDSECSGEGRFKAKIPPLALLMTAALLVLLAAVLFTSGLKSPAILVPAIPLGAFFVAVCTYCAACSAHGAKTVFMLACIICAVYLGCATYSQFGNESAESERVRASETTERAISLHLSEHPNTTYVCLLSSSSNSVTDTIFPENRLLWGGWRYYLPESFERRSNAGLGEGADGLSFIEKGILVVTDAPSMLDPFLGYVRSLSGRNVAAVPAEQVTETVVAYQIAFQEDGF